MVDAVTLEEVLSHIHNWFDRESEHINGSFAIEDGALVHVNIPEGAWYRVQGSYLNDGLHLHPADDLVDEEFVGTITVLRIPRPLLRIVEEIADWQAKYGDAASGPYSSESFENYSYTMRGESSQGNANGLSGWRLAFRDRLNAWRKIA